MGKLFPKPPKPKPADPMPDPEDPEIQREAMLEELKKRRRGRQGTVLSGDTGGGSGNDSFSGSMLGGR